MCSLPALLKLALGLDRKWTRTRAVEPFCSVVTRLTSPLSTAMVFLPTEVLGRASSRKRSESTARVVAATLPGVVTTTSIRSPFSTTLTSAGAARAGAS